MRVRSPKLGTPEAGAHSAWYPYYAGYSAAFVEDVLTSIKTSGPVLDPWNGSGTTTMVARTLGVTAVGFDINPALVLVAKGRLLDRDVLPSLAALTVDIVKKSRRYRRLTEHSDGLLMWFTPETAATLRGLSDAIRTLLVSADSRSASAHETVDSFSSLAAFYYVTLFRTLRSFLSRFRTSNPTWMKTPRTRAERLCLPRAVIETTFTNTQESLSAYLAQHAPSGDATVMSHLGMASSTALPVPSGTIGGVVSSPPYCTRIDYAVATLPELAVLRYHDPARLRALRDNMIGSPTMSTSPRSVDVGWGQACLHFLRAVRRHVSKASSTYYYKYFVQYFGLMWESFSELERVLVPHAPCALVVQDSYYKDIHNDLAAILADMVSARGWSIESRTDFKVHHNMATMNAAARKYKRSFAAVESLLVLRTP